jgi:hypothetical protein
VERPTKRESRKVLFISETSLGARGLALSRGCWPQDKVKGSFRARSFSVWNDLDTLGCWEESDQKSKSQASPFIPEVSLGPRERGPLCACGFPERAKFHPWRDCLSREAPRVKRQKRGSCRARRASEAAPREGSRGHPKGKTDPATE